MLLFLHRLLRKAMLRLFGPATRLAASPADLGHVVTVLAHRNAAFATCTLRFLRRKTMRRPSGLSGFPAFPRYDTLPLRIHRGESTATCLHDYCLFWHVPSLYRTSALAACHPGKACLTVPPRLRFGRLLRCSLRSGLDVVPLRLGRRFGRASHSAQTRKSCYY